MNHEEKLKEKIGKSHGFKTPDDFLEPVFKRISENLPEREEVVEPERTFWQKIRAYVYLAAMFGGIWCTMRIVSDLKISQKPELSLDNPPTLVAKAIETPEVEEQLNLSQQVSDAAIVTDAVLAYDDIDEFAEDFDYEFSPEVESIDVESIQAEVGGSNTNDETDIPDEEFYYDYYDYYASL